jgi:hypothetical protein
MTDERSSGRSPLYSWFRNGRDGVTIEHIDRVSFWLEEAGAEFLGCREYCCACSVDDALNGCDCTSCSMFMDAIDYDPRTDNL